MKKFSLITTLALLLMLTACSDDRSLPNSSSASSASASEGAISSEVEEESSPVSSESSEEEEIPQEEEVELSEVLALKMFAGGEFTDDILNVNMTLHNPTEESLNVAQSFYIEKLHEDGSYRRVDIPSGDVYGILDTASYQYPILADESRNIGAYIGALGVFDDVRQVNVMPTGNYRIFITVNDTQLSADFLIKETVQSDATLFSVSCEEQFYLPDAEEVTIFISNRSENDIEYNASPPLEYFDEDSGVWILAPTDPDVTSPNFGSTPLYAGGRNTDTIPLSAYLQPLNAGTYRFAYSLVPSEDHYAVFKVE